jgi:hypothetical protein
VADGEQIPGLGPRTDKPRLNPGADLTAHRLTPVEGFVLSRVDGTVSYDEICIISSLSGAATLEILRRLKTLGLILGPDDPVPPAAPAPRGAPLVGDPLRRPTPDRRSLLERLDDGSPVDPAEIAPGPDLPAEFKMRLVRLHRRLRSLDAHEILGLSPDADRATIKRAYYAASKELHPDRYYGKDLAGFREKLGDIFARLTEAFQSLEQKK